MKILFDQGTPVPLRNVLGEHEVVTAFERSWGLLKNGDLLSMAEAEGFDAIVTTDQHLRHQQNLDGRRLAIVVLMTTNWRLINIHAARVADTLAELAPGQYVELSFPSGSRRA